MALDATAVRVAGTTRIYLGEVGVTFPGLDDAISDTDFAEVGYITTDGLTFSFGRDITEINAMQSAEAIRTTSTRLPKTVRWDQMQSTRDNFLLAMGGGEWTSPEAGVYRFDPPDVSEIVERAVLVDMVDGDNHYRWYFKRAQNREGVEFKYVRDDAATFPVTLAILAAPDGSVPFYILSDDTALAPPAGP